MRRCGYPGSDKAAALKRLQRLGARPQFICHEGKGVSATKQYLKETGIAGNFTIHATGFRNHNDAWLLRPSPVRKTLRSWLETVLAD